MPLQILQISNGFIVYETIEDLPHALYFRSKNELTEFLGKNLPEIETE